MSDTFTQNTNAHNVSLIRNQIAEKNSSMPFFANISNQTITDYDSHPYTRWFRGIPHSDRPVIIEREAGWRPRVDKCYKTQKSNEKSIYPNHCFAGSCSTVYPCYPEYLDKWGNKKSIDLILNKSCTVQYR